MIKATSVVAFLIVALFGLPASAQDSESNSDLARSLLVTGKMTGICGIMKLQVQYQENTLLDGGYVFIARFWMSEAARLGMTLDEFVAQCRKTAVNYQDFYEMLGSDE